MVSDEERRIIIKRVYLKNLIVYIPTTDNKGKMSWERITKITRHDPSEFIYKIKTKSGRSVKVVESKSLLIWNEKIQKYEPKLTKDVQIGNYVPICCNLSNNNVNTITHINSPIIIYTLFSAKF